MVKTVLSLQCSVFREFAETPKLLRSHSAPLKQVCFLFSFLITEYWALNTGHARDLGTHGIIYPIDEENPLVHIQQKLKKMEERGELERHNLILQKKTKAAIERPPAVEGITKTIEVRVFYYDPTYAVKEDLKDHQGQIFIKKGTRVNPLETASLSQNLIFFDGDDEQQKAWVLEKIKEASSKLILVKGAPLALSEELKVPIYFDQGGILAKKLRIQHVPALVTQDGLRLRIEEVILGENDLLDLQKDL